MDIRFHGNFKAASEEHSSVLDVSYPGSSFIDFAPDSVNLSYFLGFVAEPFSIEAAIISYLNY